MQRWNICGVGPLSLALAVIITTVLAFEAQAVIMPNEVSARFIRVENNGPPTRPLHIGEVEAFAGGVAPTPGLDGVNDFALTSKGASFEAEVVGVAGGATHGANTAPINGLLDTGGTTYSRDNAGSYTLDLGQTRSLARARVWQRFDGCCQDRLSNVTLSAFADDGGGNVGALVASQSFPAQVPTNSFAEFTLAQGVMILPGGAGAIGTETVGSARFVQVINNGVVNRLLAIGELEVFAFGVAAGPNGNAGGNNAPLNNPNDLARSAVGASIFSASTEGGHGVTSSVIDGEEETGADVWTKQQTGGGAQITVNLGNSFELGTVRVHQRNDGCCQERLSDFSVRLFADNGVGGPGSLVGSLSFPGQAPTNSFAELSFTPQFTIGAQDTLKIELDMLNKTADLLSVGSSGAGMLTIEPGATLLITLLNGDTNGAPMTFNILDFGSVTGSFTNIIAPPNIDFGNLLVDGTITTGVPEPASIGLLALGGLALLRRRRVA